MKKMRGGWTNKESIYLSRYKILRERLSHSHSLNIYIWNKYIVPWVPGPGAQHLSLPLCIFLCLFSWCLYWHNSNLLSTFLSASPYIYRAPLSVWAPWGWYGVVFHIREIPQRGETDLRGHTIIDNVTLLMQMTRWEWQRTIVPLLPPSSSSSLPFFLHSARELFPIVVPLLIERNVCLYYKTVIKCCFIFQKGQHKLRGIYWPSKGT